MQRQVFPRGRPADTAGFAGDPAATQSSVATLDQRLDAVERQMADMLRQSEENGHRLQTIEADFARFRTDQAGRIAALEQRINEGPAPVPATTAPATDLPKPAPAKPTQRFERRRRSGGGGRGFSRDFDPGHRSRRGRLHARLQAVGGRQLR